MNTWHIAIRSLRHFWQTNLAVLFGVAIATAVLTGALIVGDSMRGSLRELTLDRLGKIDEVIVSDGFFRSELATELAQTEVFQQEYERAVPAILFPNGSVESSLEPTAPEDPVGGVARANNVNVIAIGPDFWNLSDSITGPDLESGQVAINQALADDLFARAGSTGGATGARLPFEITLRVPKPTQLPSESALGKTSDLVVPLVDLEVVQVLPNKSLGRFGLHPSQLDSPNLFLPIEMMQDVLAAGALSHKEHQALANAIFLAGKNGTPPVEVTDSLKRSLRPSMADFGLSLKRVTIGINDPESAENGKKTAEYWSLSSDRLVLPRELINAVDGVINGQPVFTYLANDIRVKGAPEGIPYSMVSAIEFNDGFAPVDIAGEPITRLVDDQIVLNEWSATDLGASVGDEIEVRFFEPETTHGAQVERTASFKLVAIAKLTQPRVPFDVVRRRELIPAVFDQPPTLANDPDLTPEVPGVTDAETVENWDLPFETKGKLRPADDDYWKDYRTTPKAFLTLPTGRKLWSSRFGNTTSLRIPNDAGSRAEIETRILDQLVASDTQLGFEIIPIKRNGLDASSGSTPFDVLFLALSMFVIASALILVSLLFRLGLQGRASEVGIYEAIGFQQSTIISIWLREMLIVCVVGALIGIAIGVGYAWLMVWGLTTWWVGAISKPIITMHVSPLSLVIGMLAGVLICVLTLWWSLRRTAREPVAGLLAGELESEPVKKSRRGRFLGWAASTLIVVGVLLSIAATQLSGDAQAGAFMGSGFLVLVALLMLVYRWLRIPARYVRNVEMSLTRLAVMSGRRNPLRSTLTIGLVAVASFLIVAVSSFRLAPTEQGTAGFDWVAESSQPVFADLNTFEGQARALGAENQLDSRAETYSFRLKPGEDASCNNLYQSTQPQVLGVTDAFIARFDEPGVTRFLWGGSTAESELEQQNPWRLLKSDTDDGSIPVIIDKNTANYSLKIFAVGGNFTAHYDSGETVTFRVVGFLANSVLQGNLIIAEDAFVSAFPQIGGYRYFMINDGGDDSVIPVLEDRLSDNGFDARSADRMLENFMQVQNTYLNTFQSLGGLGLLFGTFGLAAVQIRNVVQRRGELGLMRAVGFTKPLLSRMVLIENAWLLLLGLGAGLISALFATVPHYFIGSASMPWLELGLMFVAITVTGLVAGWVASRQINRVPLLESLRV